jgi:Response regulator receiver domain
MLPLPSCRTHCRRRAQRRGTVAQRAAGHSLILLAQLCFVRYRSFRPLRLSRAGDGRMAGRVLGAGNSGVEAPLPSMSVRNRTVTVLLVEDEILVRLLMVDILEDVGFRVIVAANAGMALNWLEGGKAVQVLFTDVHMPPGIDGLELARRVHERWPEISLGVGKTAEVALNLLFNRSG